MKEARLTTSRPVHESSTISICPNGKSDTSIDSNGTEVPKTNFGPHKQIALSSLPDHKFNAEQLQKSESTFLKVFLNVIYSSFK